MKIKPVEKLKEDSGKSLFTGVLINVWPRFHEDVVGSCDYLLLPLARETALCLPNSAFICNEYKTDRRNLVLSVR